MLYHEFNAGNIAGIENYLVYIESAGNIKGFTKIVGIMDDKEISLPFGVKLTNNGSIGGAQAMMDMVGGVAKSAGKHLADSGIRGTMAASKISKFTNFMGAVSDIAGGINKGIEGITGINLAEKQAVYSVVRPDEWNKPNISFSCTFYKGMTIQGQTTKSFREFAQNLARPMLPSETKLAGTSVLESNQVSYGDYKTLISEGMGGKGDSVKTMGFKVTVGKVLGVSSGLWMTSAKISAPTIFDANGDPLVWSVDFEFEYYRMPTYEDVQGWLK